MTQIRMTLNRHIAEQQRQYPEARGDFTALLTQIALAAKVISREVHQASLVDILGQTNTKNVHGEDVMKLDLYAHQAMVEALEYSGQVCALASEEAEEPIHLTSEYPRGQYVVLFDPLDGSSNIDVGITIGTIFSIHRKISVGEDSTLADLLQPGFRQVAAGYVVYGSCTMLVYTTGNGVHGYTLAPTVGEFLLTHKNIQLPARGKTYSVNSGNYTYWHPAMQQYIDHLGQQDANSHRPYSLRYVGSLVADFHRTLLQGGIFCYPGDAKSPSGKLRLMYEASPLALIAREAGGRASDGTRDILDIQPTTLHQRVPLFIGSREDVSMAEQFLKHETPLTVVTV